MRVLILGGTAEARELARRLASAAVPFTSSLAGRVSRPALPVGDVRVGGFGGVDGLAAFLADGAYTHVVDATHPFAATITAHAVAACERGRLPLVVVRRAGWSERPGDAWTRVPDIAAAAAAVRASVPGTVFLTTGRRDLAAFAGDAEHHFVVRTVDPPDVPLPPSATLIQARGPYDLAGELALLRAHDVALLVTKDSGGSLTVAKLDAARELGIPVVVVDRPPLPTGVEPVADVSSVPKQLGIAAG